MPSRLVQPGSKMFVNTISGVHNDLGNLVLMSVFLSSLLRFAALRLCVNPLPREPAYCPLSGHVAVRHSPSYCRAFELVL